MHLGLHGKHVLITGGSKGLGLACARVFVAEGARPTLVARTPDRLAAAALELGGVATVAADLTDADSAASMVDEVESRIGPVDILVNSAGAARRSPPDDLMPAHWRAAMDAKFFSYINVIDPLIKRMAVRGHGVIVNIIGQGGKIPSPFHLPGGSANAALMLASAGLASAYAARGVRVVGVNPGTVNTDRVAEGLAAEARSTGITPAEALQRALQRQPTGRFAEPEEIARIVVFAASEHGRHLSGANISADGGNAPAVV